MTTLQPLTKHRTQVYFPPYLYEGIKRVSKKEDISISEIIRRAVEKEIEMKRGKRVDKERKREKIWQKFFASAGIGKGPKDLSYNHDKYFRHT